jgi:hypothetical protein
LGRSVYFTHKHTCIKNRKHSPTEIPTLLRNQQHFSKILIPHMMPMKKLVKEL